MAKKERRIELVQGAGAPLPIRMNAVLRAYMKASTGDSKGKKANPAKAHANRGRAKRVRGGK